MTVPPRPTAAPALARALAGVRVTVASAVLQARADRSPTLLVQGVVQPAAFTLIALMAQRAGPDEASGRAALGCGLVCLWGVAIWQSGLVLRRETWEGTLTSLASRPAPLLLVVAGKSLGATARAALLIAVTVECTALAVGQGVPVRRPLVFLAAAGAAVLSASAMGLLLSCLFLLSRAAIRLAEALGYPVFILGGLLIPLSLLPSWAGPLSAAVSLRWAGELLGSASFGGPLDPAAWLWLAVTSVVYAVAGGVLLALTLRRARRKGNLDLF